MKTYEVTMTYEYTVYADEEDIIQFFIDNFDMIEEEAKKHFESLSDSDIEEIIVYNSDWEPTCMDDFTFIESTMNVDYGTYKD